MRAFCLTLAALAIMSSTTQSYAGPSKDAASSPWKAGTIWAVLVFGPDHKLVGSMVIRVTNAPADSCIAGTWNRVDVLRYQSDDPRFLAKRPLSYALDGDALTLGANEICDAYLHLHGTLANEAATGDYESKGLRGPNYLGSFAAVLVQD